MGKQLLLILIIFLFNCENHKSQENRSLKQNKMEKFDLKLFKANQKANQYQYKEDKRTIVLMRLSEGYTKITLNDDNAFQDRIVYYDKELTPRVIAKKIHDMFIGTIKYYDVFGNLNDERDMDAPFTYSIYDLSNWIKEKYNINIFENKPDCLMSRNAIPFPYYMVKFITNDGKHIVYKINGEDGKIIYQNIDGEEREVNPMPNPKADEEKKDKGGFLSFLFD